MPATVVPFRQTPVPDIAEVGGKAESLARMAQAGLPVPDGFACTVSFFAPWLAEVRASAAWQRLQDALASGADLDAPTRAVQAVCAGLSLSADQVAALSGAVERLPPDSIFAVRSSSPEEDLAGASFAGGYETILGTTRETLPAALRTAFASAFDKRVFVYKAAHGFSVANPRIAVVVQLQIDTSVAGVGFSLNPLNNDHDEVVINASHGLGESVVSGLVTPDQFVVDKVAHAIVDRTLGAKARVVTLGPDGGTVEGANPRAAEPSLTDAQVLEVASLTARVEAAYGTPMDIEWGYADGALHLLQARPITTYVPLVPKMMTAPGEPRRLYFDFGLVDMMTINQPMMPLTLDWLFGSLGMWITPFIGPVDLQVDGDPAESVVFGAGGRGYVNISQVLTMVDLRRFAGSGSGTSQMDELTANLLGNIDVERYRARRKVGRLRWSHILWNLPRALAHMAVFGVRVLDAILRPDKVHRDFEQEIERTIRRLGSASYDHLSVRELIEHLDAELTPVIGETAAPPMSVYIDYMMTYMGDVERLIGTENPEDRRLAEALSRGFAGNEATSIGIQLYRMSRMLDPDELHDLDALAGRLERRDLPDAFLAAWDAFVREFGARGPSELELSNARYGDDPRVALEQVSYMAGTEFDPEVTQQQHVDARHAAYEALLARRTGSERRKLERVYKMLDLYGPARDTPKYLWVLDNGLVRRRALREGARLAAEGRLDAAEDIFWFTLDELDAANADPGFDLRAVRETRRPFYEKLDRVVTFPHLIDSRGRIVQVPRPAAEPGVLVGQGISSGRAVGRVKVLHGPRDKPIEKGDVLVTYTTDPGWTPLFVNAEAIVLEIGGMLQHGGVVAREYGKPCVVGIQGITKALRDGQLVEVDGAAGTVRLLDEVPVR